MKKDFKPGPWTFDNQNKYADELGGQCGGTNHWTTTTVSHLTSNWPVWHYPIVDEDRRRKCDNLAISPGDPVLGFIITKTVNTNEEMRTWSLVTGREQC